MSQKSLWYDLQFLKKVGQTEIGNYGSYHHFTHVYQKPQSSEVWLLRYGVRYFFLSFWGQFLPFDPPNNPKNQNSHQNEKRIWRYHFTHVYQKS